MSRGDQFNSSRAPYIASTLRRIDMLAAVGYDHATDYFISAIQENPMSHPQKTLVVMKTRYSSFENNIFSTISWYKGWPRISLNQESIKKFLFYNYPMIFQLKHVEAPSTGEAFSLMTRKQISSTI